MARTGRPRTLENVKCEGPGCEVIFRPKLAGQKYHGRECYRKARTGVPIVHSRKPTGRPRIYQERTCALPGCEKKFYPERIDHLYHSKECYHAGATGQERGPYMVDRWVKKKCEACLLDFEVPYYARAQRFHDKDCRDVAKYRRGMKCNEMTPVQASGWAHMIDGEGSVILYMRRDAVGLMVTITNTYRPMLEQVANETGVGAIVAKASPKENHKQGYAWRCNAEAAETFLQQVKPYLRIKMAQADLAIWFQERLRTPALKADRAWQYEARAAMQAMNKRGPSVDIPPVTGWTPPM